MWILVELSWQGLVHDYGLLCTYGATEVVAGSWKADYLLLCAGVAVISKQKFSGEGLFHLPGSHRRHLSAWLKKHTGSCWSNSAALLGVHWLCPGTSQMGVWGCLGVLAHSTNPCVPPVTQWLERPLGVWEAGVRSATTSHQRRKKWEVLPFSAWRLATYHQG